MSAKISIIIPCYKQGQYLDDCLTSILNQKYTNWECIIVNDGSPDHTEEKAREWLLKDDRFIYISQENGGVSKARNAGLKIAKGEWIQFLDCDDILEESKLLEASKFFNQDIDITLSGYRYFETSEGPEYSRIFGRNYLLPEVCIDSSDTTDLLFVFFEKNPFVISSPIYRKKIFDEIGYFDESLICLEDWEFNIRCCVSGYSMQHIGYLPKSKTLIRLHNDSVMRNNTMMDKHLFLFRKILLTDEKYRDKYSKFLENQNDIKDKSFKEKLILWVPPILVKSYRKYLQDSILKMN